MTVVDNLGVFITRKELTNLKRILTACKFSDRLQMYLESRVDTWIFFDDFYKAIKALRLSKTVQSERSSCEYEMDMVCGRKVQRHRFVYYSATNPTLKHDEILNLMDKRMNEGFVIPHIDRNKFNNSIFNLYEVHKDNHASLHSLAYRDPIKQFELVKKTISIIEASKRLK